MKKAILFSILLSVMFLVGVGNSFAVEVTCFENSFTRVTGAPVTEYESFPGVAGDAVLRIINGAEDDSFEKVSSSVISINCVDIATPDNFSQNVNYIEIPIVLNGGENALAVKLMGKPGGTVFVSIVQDVDAEAAAVIGPEGGIVEVTDPESELYGVKIEVPEAALETYEIIKVSATSFNLNFSEKQEIILISPAILIQPDYLDIRRSCTIVYPYHDTDNDGFIDGTSFSENHIQVYFSLIEYDEWAYHAEDYIIDTINNEVRINSLHFSKWKIIGKRWKDGVTVYYHIDSVPDNGDDEDVFKNEVSTAFSLWQRSLSNLISFEETNNLNEVDISIRKADFCDLLHPWPIWRCDAAGRNILNKFTGRSLTYFNTNIDGSLTIWKASEYCDLTITGIPFLRIALHEIGHTLGLSDIRDRENSCSWRATPCNQNCDINNRVIMRYDAGAIKPHISLSCLDIAEVREHYDLPEPPDDDSDGISNLCDNCPNTYNPSQEDSNGDRIGDACELIAHYSFSGDANDSEGNHDGNIVGNVSIGNTAVFDGTGHIEISASSDFNLQEYTISAWFKPESNRGFVLAHGEDAATDTMQWSIQAARGTTNRMSWFESSSDADYYLELPFSISDNEWHFAVVTRDASGSFKVYYGDESQYLGLQDELNNTPAPPSIDHYVSIGSRTRDGSAMQDYFYGEIDEVRIYSKALSDDDGEIEDIYDLGR